MFTKEQNISRLKKIITVAFPVVNNASWLILETSGELFIIVFTLDKGNKLSVLSAMLAIPQSCSVAYHFIQSIKLICSYKIVTTKYNMT